MDSQSLMRLPFQLSGFPPRVGLGETTVPNGLGKGSGGERKTHMKTNNFDPRFSEPDAYDDEGNLSLNSWEMFMKEELLRDAQEEGRNG